MSAGLKFFGSILLLVSVSVFGQQEAPLSEVQQEKPEEIIVTGRYPGPPLWRVGNGENVLWIFANFSPSPKGMQWDSARVEQVLGEADEYLAAPMQGISLSLAEAAALLNPISIFRGVRLMKRLSHNPDGKLLKDTLPADDYQRFAALKRQYFPKDKDIEELRPLYAMQNMTGTIQKQAGLESSNAIRKQIDKLASKNQKLKRTATSANLNVTGSYGDVAKRAEAWNNSLPVEKERACFEQALRSMELDLDAMKARAASWAQGHVDEFREIVLREPEENPCLAMLSASSEGSTFDELQNQSQQRWLDAAEHALATSHSTFAVLGIDELLKNDGLLSKLREKGYSIREPN